MELLNLAPGAERKPFLSAKDADEVRAVLRRNQHEWEAWMRDVAPGVIAELRREPDDDVPAINAGHLSEIVKLVKGGKSCRAAYVIMCKRHGGYHERWRIKYRDALAAALPELATGKNGVRSWADMRHASYRKSVEARMAKGETVYQARQAVAKSRGVGYDTICRATRELDPRRPASVAKRWAMWRTEYAALIADGVEPQEARKQVADRHGVSASSIYAVTRSMKIEKSLTRGKK